MLSSDRIHIKAIHNMSAGYMRDFIMAKVWQDFVHQVNGFDKKIETTNPFSEENYYNKKYSTFHEFYYPREEHIIVWVEDDEDEN